MALPSVLSPISDKVDGRYALGVLFTQRGQSVSKKELEKVLAMAKEVVLLDWESITTNLSASSGDLEVSVLGCLRSGTYRVAAGSAKAMSVEGLKQLSVYGLLSFLGIKNANYIVFFVTLGTELGDGIIEARKSRYPDVSLAFRNPRDPRQPVEDYVLQS